jgi:mannose-6-phosphate isomerase-like protein (cupin superfamily)
MTSETGNSFGIAACRLVQNSTVSRPRIGGIAAVLPFAITTSGRHWHLGEEIVYVLEGSLEYKVAGKPRVMLNAGGTLFIPARTIHEAKNVGSGNGAELATYVVEKDKQLVVMVR